MSTPLRLDGLLAKEESSYGVDPTPTVGDDGLRVSERVWSSLTHEFAFPNRRDDVVSGTLTPPRPAARKGRIVTLDIGVDAKGAGTAYSSSTPVRPELDPLLYACGVSRTHTDTGGSEKVDYDPADTSHGSATIWAYAGGKLFKVVGCRGNLVIPIRAGQVGVLRFQMQGMLSADPTEVALPSITYDAVVPEAAVGLSLQIGSGAWSPNVLSAEFDMGNDVQRLDDANGSDGIEGFFIAGRTPSFRVTCREDQLSNYDPYGTAQDVSSGEDIDLTLGSTQYNRMKLDVDSGAWLEQIEHPEDNQHAGWGLMYQLTDWGIVFD